MPARHAILGLLMERPMHGYEIDGEFERGLRDFCHINISQIYAYLKSMERKGWVESQTIIQKSNPPKKVFHVTRSGREEMERWISRPALPKGPKRDELRTRIFLCSRLAPKRLGPLVEEQIRIQRARVDELTRQIESSRDPIQRIFLDAERRHASADRDWLASLREYLVETSPTPELAPTAVG